MERKRSESLVQAQKRYDATLRKVTVKFNRRTEADLVEWIEGVEKKQTYIKALIRKDMENNRDTHRDTEPVKP